MTPQEWRIMCSNTVQISYYEGTSALWLQQVISRGEVTAKKIAANNKNAIRLSHVRDAEAYYMAGGYYKEWMAKEAMK